MSAIDQFSRRDFVKLTGCAAATALTSRLVARGEDPKPPPGGQAAPRLNADESLRDLLEGNARFMKGEVLSPRRRPEDFAALAEGQRPDAVIVGCADSRVPPEVLFDQGVGDLFVVRIAGNIIGGTGPAVHGSIEYGIAELGAPLIVVLGHSQCGAVKAAIKHIEANDFLPGAIDDLVNLLKPVVARVRSEPGDLLENAIRANVVHGVERLKALDPVVAPAVKEGKVKVIGAIYDLRTGRVTQVA